MKISLSGKVALVTGGSRGIGRAICTELASSGATVFINFSSNASAAEETASLCRQQAQAAGLTPQVEVLGFDVAQSAAVDTAFEAIKTKAGKIDILVNNAGIASDGLTLRYKDEEWQRVMGVNLDGAFYCSRAASKIMLKNRWGRIINISSVVGEMGNAGQAAYVASKAGVIGLTKSLAREFAPRNVTVNAVTPGFISTDMTAALTEEQSKALLQTIPLGRVGEPAEIAHLVAFLSSDLSSYVTGQIWGVNGGIYMD